MLIVAGDCQATVDERLTEALQVLQMGPTGTCHEVLRLQGVVRPDDQSGHEQYVNSIPSPATLSLTRFAQFWFLGRHLQSRD